MVKSRYVLVVENISSQTRVKDLIYEMEAHGDVRDAEIDRKLRVGLVEFKRSADCSRAWRKMDRFYLDGRSWKVDYAVKADFKDIGWKWFEDDDDEPPSRSKKASDDDHRGHKDKDKKEKESSDGDGDDDGGREAAGERKQGGGGGGGDGGTDDGGDGGRPVGEEDKNNKNNDNGNEDNAEQQQPQHANGEAEDQAPTNGDAAH